MQFIGSERLGFVAGGIVRRQRACIPPVFVQAGASDRGRDFAARWAEVVFVTPGNPDAARDFRLDLRARAERFGRNPDDIKVLPGIAPIIAETTEAAEVQQVLLSSL
jgi:alkanesulfonate monooxygenase SsuD/methylene tetrahydromethanopterin reductase-like flavin-dependent oxidoreductase (luciferase family)